MESYPSTTQQCKPTAILSYAKKIDLEKCTRIFFWVSIFALSYLLIAPLWVITYLPLGDLPDHAAQIRVITEFENYSDNYRLNWFTPYWVGYGITLLFTSIFSVVTSIKLVLSLALLATVAACGWVIKTRNGSPYWIWICFPLAYSYAFYWGFFSYIVATPIAIAFFAYCNGYGQRELSVKGFLLTAAFSLLLFFAHALAWALSVAIAICIVFIHNSCRETIKKSFAFIAILPLVFYWVSLSGPKTDSPSIEFGYYIDHIASKINAELSYIMLNFSERGADPGHFDRIKQFFAFAVGKAALWDFIVIALLISIWPKLIGAKVSFNWRRWMPALALFCAFMIIPHWIFNTAYIYQRFAVFLIPLLFFIYDMPAEPAKKSFLLAGRYALGLLLSVGLLLMNLSTFKSFQQNDEDFKEILAAMENDKKVMVLVISQDSAMRYSAAYNHYGSWYQAEKLGEMTPNFSHDPGAENVPVRYKFSLWKFPSTWNPGEFDWYKHSGNRYDYFLVKAKQSKQHLFHQAGNSINLIKQQGEWQLYGRSELALPLQ